MAGVDSLGPNPIWGRYGEEKVVSEKILWDAYAEGRYAVTCFRFPFILGPGNFADRESFVFSRLEAGRPILLAGGGWALNQFVYVDDVARRWWPPSSSRTWQPDRRTTARTAVPSRTAGGSSFAPTYSASRQRSLRSMSMLSTSQWPPLI